MKIETIAIADIVISDRRREEYGDLQALADSIAKYGLFHPITVDDHNNLVAGERRLKACKMLEWSEIPARLYRELTDVERREIELEENIRRKDLTALELSKHLVALAETAAEVLATSAKTKTKGGRPTNLAVSETIISERIGVPRRTINEAQRHVAAVNKYPELASIIPTQKDTITVAKNLDALPEDKRTEARSRLMSHDQSTLATLADKPPMPIHKAKPKTAGDKWRDRIQDMRQFVSSINQIGGAGALTAAWTQQQSVLFLADLIEFRSDLDGFINELEERFDELKQQVG